MTTHNAKDILVEALDTIRATFWIQSQEVVFLNGVYTDGNYDWSDWDSHTKAKTVELDEDHWVDCNSIRNPEADDKAKVVGVCSIGALALANVTLYDEPLTTWLDVSDRDFETWKAGQALAQVIVEGQPNYLDNITAGDIIASWNDYDDRTRDEVIDAFEKALSSPLLGAEQLYEVIYEGQWGRQSSWLYFASEADAQAFLDTESPLRKMVYRNLGTGELKIVPFVHDSQVTA